MNAPPPEASSAEMSTSGSTGASPELPGAGLYVHVPFCSAVCPYCDFAVTVGGVERREAFVGSLLDEIAWWAGRPEGLQPFDTVYFGGGTPSALVPKQLGRILDGLAELLGVPLAAGEPQRARVQLEANPEDVTAESVEAWRRLGVGTLSLGVQSFDASALGFLGRRHTAAEARRAVEVALGAGFATVSVDLIYGLPGQTAADWRCDLEAAIALGPDHLSCYQLTVHEGTPFGRRRERGELVEMPDDGQAELFALTHDLLADAGYPAYEVSNFARSPEHRSAHNRKYWDHTPYLGLGPSAHSFGGLRHDAGEAGAGGGGGESGESAPSRSTASAPERVPVRPAGRRWWNERRLAGWRARLVRGEAPVAGEEILGAAELALERLMLALRTPEGLDLDRFAARYGIDLETVNRDRIAGWVEAGLVTRDDRRLAPTRRGLAVADSLATALEI